MGYYHLDVGAEMQLRMFEPRYRLMCSIILGPGFSQDSEGLPRVVPSGAEAPTGRFGLVTEEGDPNGVFQSNGSVVIVTHYEWAPDGSCIITIRCESFFRTLETVRISVPEMPAAPALEAGLVLESADDPSLEPLVPEEAKLSWIFARRNPFRQVFAQFGVACFVVVLSSGVVRAKLGAWPAGLLLGAFVLMNMVPRR
eukprot:TRINITY_DN13867_c0_g1_i4.p1 TRINITY_DN13867_c0_g1~~TRINITY_DN13867_c0_g1_i4.p1  ORF type:complete len:198 (-),score=29.80 TRINITY_DN13867_c0_g1_i4:97-690(-)